MPLYNPTETISTPPEGYSLVKNIYVEIETGKLVIEYDDEVEGGE